MSVLPSLRPPAVLLLRPSGGPFSFGLTGCTNPYLKEERIKTKYAHCLEYANELGFWVLISASQRVNENYTLPHT